MNIAVVTAITSQKDDLVDPKANGEFIAFCDKPFETAWQYRPAYNNFKSPRRNSRIHKILIHQFVNADYSIWMDGNISINENPQVIIDEWLKDANIAAFQHPKQHRIYDEIIACMGLNLENEIPELIEQMKSYSNVYLRCKLICELGVIVRRHNAATEKFNNYWWSEYCRHSSRDQVSFMHTVEKLGMKIKVIEPIRDVTKEDRWGHPYFTYRQHRW
jgi:hypothetical protein